ncbi:MAG TPA: protein-methionine-sulfoxide reductase catalytic subunit MsrP [Myxococcota bacterium]|nr:protein-methionine-sulfoxide reductase catalytic subunit MsrP [Myxococcota bacterium]
MLIRRNRFLEPPEREVTGPELYLRRRELVVAAGIAAGALLLPGCGRAEKGDPPADSPANPAEVTSPDGFRTTEEQTPFDKASSYNNFYEFGTDKEDPKESSGGFVPKPWSVEISGEVAKPGSVALEDLVKPADVQERIYRMRCVEAWSMVIPWRGVPLKDVLARFEPTPKAKYVAFKTVLRPEQMPGQRRHVLDWPYVEGLRMDEAMHPLALLATGMYGRDLPNQNGAPLRLVVPWKYGFKGIKSIVQIHLQESQPPTTWNLSAPDEYGFYANVNPDVDHPRWTQRRERRIGEFSKRKTLPFNGYADQVAALYAGMDLRANF